MKKKICAAPLMMLMAQPVFAQTLDVPMPDFYGSVRAQASWHENYDYKSEIYQAEVGAVGMLKAPNLNVKYQLEAEYSESNPDKADDNDLIVREASMTLMNKSYGGLHIGSGTSGAWKDVYSKVDIFESNNMERHSETLLFTGKRYGSAQFAYSSPKFYNFQLKAAVMSPDERNGSDIDSMGVRLTYESAGFAFAVNQSFIDKKMPVEREKNSARTIAAASYQWDDFYVAALAEFDHDMFYKTAHIDKNTYALSTRYQWNDTAFKLGYQYADWQGARDNESLVLANITHDITPNIALFVEGALFTEDGSTYETNKQPVKGDNLNIGVILSL